MTAAAAAAAADASLGLTPEQISALAADAHSHAVNIQQQAFSIEQMCRAVKQNAGDCEAIMRRVKQIAVDYFQFDIRLQKQPMRFSQTHDLSDLAAASKALGEQVMQAKVKIQLQMLPLRPGPPNQAVVFSDRQAFNQIHARLDAAANALVRAMVERPQPVTVESQRALLNELRRQIDTELSELDTLQHVPLELLQRPALTLEDERKRWLRLAIDQKHLREIPASQVRVEKFLRRGGFGSVSRASWLDTPVVLKYLFDASTFVEEVRMLKRIHDGDYVVKLHGIMYDKDGQPGMIMKYAANGSLVDYLAKYHARLSWPQRALLAEQIAIGLGFIHRDGILHGDFHSGNVLVDANGSPMITDFGLAKSNKDVATATDTGVIGIVAYIAPERLSTPSMTYTEAMDIYSFGWLCWEIASGKRPFGGRNDVSLVFDVLVNSTREAISSDVPRAYRRVVEGCWQEACAERLELGEARHMLHRVVEGHGDGDAEETMAGAQAAAVVEVADDDEHVVLQLDSAYVSGFNDTEEPRIAQPDGPRTAVGETPDEVDEDDDPVVLQLDSAYVSGWQ